ncbi:MAG: hypothetical protein NUV74_14875, partial [Candidatus Brocadiaceae bacterium]|nr:hypothetical protein [Candidatus Brocadiaceae bacterium]
MIRRYDPAYYFNPETFHPGSAVTGEFTNAPCVTCHMQDGEHNVTKTSTVYTFMGTSLVDHGAYRYKATRDAWINTCKGCHSPRFARDHLNAMDEAVKLSFTKYREAMGILMALYAD